MYPQARKKQSRRRIYVMTLILALGVHLLLLVLGWLAAGWLEWGKPKRDLAYRQFRVSLETEKKTKKPDPTKQVVTIPAPKQEKAPKKYSFLSEYDSSVKKETQARNKRLAPKVAASYNPKPNPVSPLQPSMPQKGTDTQKTHKDIEKNLKPTPEALRMRTTPKNPKESEYKVTDKKTQKDSNKQPLKKSLQGKKQLKLSDMRLTDKQLGKAIGAPFPDYLGNVPEGKKTLLNTKRWKFSSFFNRVKRAVAQQWKPGQVYRRHDPTGNIYGFQSRLTVLKVTLDKDGTIKKIVLQRPCGLGFLDDEAVRAFKAAGPFPNPPSRLVDSATQKITFSFGFLFEITRSPSFRIFRYK